MCARRGALQEESHSAGGCYRRALPLPVSTTAAACPWVTITPAGNADGGPLPELIAENRSQLCWAGALLAGLCLLQQSFTYVRLMLDAFYYFMFKKGSFLNYAKLMTAAFIPKHIVWLNSAAQKNIMKNSIAFSFSYFVIIIICYFGPCIGAVWKSAKSAFLYLHKWQLFNLFLQIISHAKRSFITLYWEKLIFRDPRSSQSYCLTYLLPDISVTLNGRPPKSIHWNGFL